MRTIDDAVERLRAEYLEMPGLQLNAEQVQRLCGTERKICRVALDTLVNANFLCVKQDGHYARLVEDHFSRPRHVKADLGTERRPVKVS
jgi:hypothetical protein